MRRGRRAPECRLRSATACNIFFHRAVLGSSHLERRIVQGRRFVRRRAHVLQLRLAVDQHVAARDDTLAFLHAFEHFPEVVAGPAENHAPLLIRAVALIDINPRIVARPKHRALRHGEHFRRIELDRAFRVKLVPQLAIRIVDLDPNAR